MSLRVFHDAVMETMQALADLEERNNEERYARNRSLVIEITDAIRRVEAIRRLELSLQRRAA